MDQQLVALYELRRQSFLIGYIQNPNSFDDALAFAYYHRLAPIFHQNIERETYEGGDPFADIYAVKALFVKEVLDYVERCWLDEQLAEVQFCKLEDKFGGYKVNRMELVFALKYARIGGRFDEAVWKAIETGAPSEASSLSATFSPKDVGFY